VELSSCEQARLTPPASSNERGGRPPADLANVWLTMALDMWGRTWTPRPANVSYGPVSCSWWTRLDSQILLRGGRFVGISDGNRDGNDRSPQRPEVAADVRVLSYIPPELGIPYT